MTDHRAMAPLWGRIAALLIIAFADAFVLAGMALIATVIVQALVGGSVEILIYPIAIGLWLGRIWGLFQMVVRGETPRWKLK